MGLGDFLGSVLGTNSNYSASPYAAALSPQEGIDQYLEDLNRKADIYHEQQSLAQALQAQMNGTGPNPAQTQYLQNVQNNIANAQGLIASQRGLNPGMAARMGSNIAARSNQEASLGSALLQQQQQLGATANLGNLYGQMQGGNLAYLGGQNNLNTAANQLNYGVAQGNAANNAAIVGGLIGAGGSVGAAAAKGGGGASAAPAAAAAANGGIIKGKAKFPGNSYSNDTVPAMLSPGEGVIDREHMTSRESAHAKVDQMFDAKDGGHEHRKEFLDHLMKTHNKKKVGYGDVLAARRKKAA